MTEYVFRIVESFTPANIPMARLAEYMAEYAKLLGESSEVHFARIVDASVGLAARVEHQAEPKVEARLQAVAAGLGPEDARKAAARLDDMLAADNATGEVLRDGAEIIPFPGKTRVRPATFGPITEYGIIEGEIVRVGGTDDTIHIALRDGEQIYSSCVATKEVARRLAQYLLGPVVRVQGAGKWIRHPDGEWELKSFRIRDFEVLEESSLTEVVAKLRAVPGNDWSEVEAPVQSILNERGQGGAD